MIRTIVRQPTGAELATLRVFAPRDERIYVVSHRGAITGKVRWRIYSLHDDALYGIAHLIPDTMLAPLGVTARRFDDREEPSGLELPAGHTIEWFVTSLAQAVHGDANAYPQRVVRL
jgi:hypothetical protein